MYIASVSTAQPKHHYDQKALLQAFEELWSQSHHNIDRVRQLHEAVKVGGRFLALEMDEYKNIQNFSESNDHFIRVGTELAEEVLRKGLQAANTDPSELDAIFLADEGGLEQGHVALLQHEDEVRGEVETIAMCSLPRVSDLNNAVQMQRHRYAVVS